MAHYDYYHFVGRLDPTQVNYNPAWPDPFSYIGTLLAEGFEFLDLGSDSEDDIRDNFDPTDYGDEGKGKSADANGSEGPPNSQDKSKTSETMKSLDCAVDASHNESKRRRLA